MSAHAAGWWEQYGQMVLALALVAACEVAVFFEPRSALEPLSLRLIIMGLIALPSVLALILAWGLGVVAAREGLRLHTHSGTDPLIAEAVQKSWSYERDRYRRSVSRAQFYASAFGVIATLFLTCSELLLRLRMNFVPDWEGKVQALALSIMAATGTAFLLSFAKVTVRLSSHDFSARAFSWSTRSLVLSVVAAAGLLLALQTDVVWMALLLGILAGVAGEHAMNLLLEKAPKILSLRPTYRQEGPSPLLVIDGIMAEHVDRLEEEGVLSISDLALVPTARLFFNTPYGLQMICDWQDQALLLMRVGRDRARDLFNQMGIRGAIALHRTVHDLLRAAPDDTKASRDALQRAIRLDKEAPLDPMLKAIEDDEATLRVQVHRQSIVLEPAQFDPAWSSDREDVQASGFSCAAPKVHDFAPGMAQQVHSPLPH